MSGWGIAAELGGSLVSSAASFFGQREQRSWEQEMANTAYQRSSADMKAAGLNPAMMYGGSGGAASTPNVAPPSFESPTKGLNAQAMAAKQLENEQTRVANESNLADAEVKRKAAETAALLLDPRVKEATIGKLGAETRETETRIPNVAAELDNIRAKLQAIRAETELHQASAKRVRAEIPKTEAISQVAELVGRAPAQLNTYLKGTKAPLDSIVQPLLDVIIGPPGEGGGPLGWAASKFRGGFRRESDGNVSPGGETSAKTLSQRKYTRWR